MGPSAVSGLTPSTREGLEAAFPRGRFLSLDVETTGLSATADRVRTVQVCDGESAAIVVFDEPVEARALVVLADFLRGRRIVVHNARFEGAWFREAGLTDVVLDDTALLFSAVRGMRLPKELMQSDSGRVSLANLTVMVLDEPLDKSEQVSDWAAPKLSESQMTYALNDAIVTHRVWSALRAELDAKSERFGVDIATGYEDLRYSAAMAREMEWSGVGFDAKAHAAWVSRKSDGLTAPLDAHLASLDPALTPACLSSGVRLDAFFRGRLAAYEPRQMQRAIFDWPKAGKTQKLSCGREALAEVVLLNKLHAAEQNIVETLYARAESSRGLATFGPGFAKHVVNGRLYGKLHPGGAVTGRYISSDPNLQNIPTDPEFRGFFRVPEGRLLVDVDYSQLELRVLAAMSDDTMMIAAFEDGWDYHDLVANKFGCTRRQAKAINFGIIYGKGLQSLAADLGVDVDTAAEYLAGWDEQAPTGAKWRSQRPALYIEERGVRTVRRWIDYLEDDRADASSGTRPMNFPVQGGAGDVLHRAMRLLFERYREWPGNVVPVLTIHDEILVEVDAGHALAVGDMLAAVMVEAFSDVLPNGPTRFLAIPGTGPTWAEAKADGEAREKFIRAGEKS